MISGLSLFLSTNTMHDKMIKSSQLQRLQSRDRELMQEMCVSKMVREVSTLR